MAAYYNEFDPEAAQWLRNLIAAGHIAPGDVDTRSIQDVRPDDLRGYTQCHFFAGIGGWSLALRRAGWSDDRPVWTGSCPCQPFSTAGAGAGFSDERHLWPDFAWLIAQQRPPIIFGEQVASKAVEPWLDLVSTDLEGLGFAFGALAFPSAGVGAPHIRDRAFWVGDAHHKGLEGYTGDDGSAGRQGPSRPAPPAGLSGGVADLHGNGRDQARQCIAPQRCDGLVGNSGDVARESAAGPTNSLWRDADWLLCRDGKWRPVEPGTFPLANGVSNRVGRLRAYGNAINVEAAVQFIQAYEEARGATRPRPVDLDDLI